MKIRCTKEFLFLQGAMLKAFNVLSVTVQKSCYKCKYNITLYSAALIYKYKFHSFS